jgi:rhodanese-related sulfurtransferase
MSSKTAAQMVQEAKQRVQNLTVEQVATELDQGNAVLVDIREPNEREQGAIPGSVGAPRGMLAFYADPSSPYHREEFDPNRRIILHCASGGRSALAADTLQQMGYTNVAHLDGGYKAWAAAGQPTTQSDQGGTQGLTPSLPAPVGCACQPACMYTHPTLAGRASWALGQRRQAESAAWQSCYLTADGGRPSTC